MKNEFCSGHIPVIKIIILVYLFGLVSLIPVSAQKLLNNCESVVFDAPRERYLVSNWGDGTIIQMDKNGNQSYFNTDFQNYYKIAGLYIYGDTLLAASGDTTDAGVSGFDIKTGKKLFHIPLPGVGLPNDITSDKYGIIYVTDYWGNKLYKIVNRTPSAFISSGLGYPNGITYDEKNNRLLICSVMGKGAPILAVDLPDTALSVLFETGLTGGTDGIVLDDEGRIYVSEWGGDSIYRFSENNNYKPEIFSKGHNDPADIYYDFNNNIIAVPNFSSNTVDFINLKKNIE